MDVIAEGRWSWMLYADGSRRVLCVVCGTVGLYELAIELSPDEMDGGAAAADPLARQVCDAPRDYWDRRIGGFDDEPGVREATARWRATRDAQPSAGVPPIVSM